MKINEGDVLIQKGIGKMILIITKVSKNIVWYNKYYNNKCIKNEYMKTSTMFHDIIENDFYKCDKEYAEKIKNEIMIMEIIE